MNDEDILAGIDAFDYKCKVRGVACTALRQVTDKLYESQKARKWPVVKKSCFDIANYLMLGAVRDMILQMNGVSEQCKQDAIELIRTDQSLTYEEVYGQ